MSTYSDYVARASLGFVTLTDRFARQLTLGKRDCCLENKIKILYTQLDMLPRVFNESCGDDDMESTMYFINTLIGDQSLGTSVTDTPPTITTTVIVPVPVSTEVDYCAGNTVINLYPMYVQFTKDGEQVTLGTLGTSYALNYTAYNADDEVVDVLITNRTKYGFVVRCLDEDNCTFEWNAIVQS